MKNISRALFVAALVLPTSNLQAQIDPTVEVSGVYRSNLTDVNKPHKSDNRVPESVQKFSVTSDYSIFERPYADLYEFTPYQIDSIGKTSRPKLPKFMLRGGTQYPISPELSIKSQLLSGPKWNLGVNGDFKSLFDNLDYKESPRSLGTSRVNTAFGANLKSSWRYGEIDVVADYRYDNYRDTYLDNYLNHGVKSFSIDFNAESAYPQDNSVYYNFDIKYETSSKALTGLEQLDTTYNNALFSIQGRLGSSFEKHRIYVDLIYKSAFMGKGDQQNSVGILEFTPIYEYAQDRFKIKAGARFGNKYIDKETANTVHPELDSKIELIRNGMWLRVMIGGGNDVNTVVDYIHSAPWICLGLKDGSYSVGNTIGSRNFESRVAVESIVGGRFAIAPYFEYNSYKDRMQFFTEFTSTGLPFLIPVLSSYDVTSFGVETSWKSRNLNITAKLQSNDYKGAGDAEVYMLPKMEISSSVSYDIKKRFFVGADFHYESEKNSWHGGKVPDYIDLSATATYVVNRHLSAYIKGGNLLNRHNFRYFEIPEIPLNIGGGVSVKF